MMTRAEKKQNWYFTFMFQQPERNKYVKIFGTEKEARKKMFNRFGDQWFTNYPEAGFADQIKEFGLVEIK